MEPHFGKAATGAYSPTEGHSFVIYTHKFKPEHFHEGVKIVREQFPAAQVKHGQKRLNMFIERPDDYELVNVSFFDGAGVADWHKSPHRKATLEALEHTLAKPIVEQVFKIDHLVGIS
jgi:hypothetical protein